MVRARFHTLASLDWRLLCLLWVGLESSAAYNPYNRYPAYPPRPYLNHDSRTVRSYTPSSPSEDYSDSGSSERLSERLTDDRPAMERSISVSGHLQRVQDHERRRVRPEDSIPRLDNESYKIVNQPKHHNITNRRVPPQANIQKRAGDNVVFPGPTSKPSKFELEVPKECESLGICESVPNYPEDIIDRIIQKLGDTSRFEVEELNNPEIAQRIGSGEETFELCQTNISVMVPQAIKDSDGNWRWILNKKDKPLQGFKVEICRTTGSSCAPFIFFQKGYTASCEQKYITRKVTAVDLKKEEPYDIPVKFPSCCSCIATRPGPEI